MEASSRYLELQISFGFTIRVGFFVQYHRKNVKPREFMLDPTLVGEENETFSLADAF